MQISRKSVWMPLMLMLSVPGALFVGSRNAAGDDAVQSVPVENPTKADEANKAKPAEDTSKKTKGTEDASKKAKSADDAPKKTKSTVPKTTDEKLDDVLSQLKVVHRMLQGQAEDIAELQSYAEEPRAFQVDATRAPASYPSDRLARAANGMPQPARAVSHRDPRYPKPITKASAAFRIPKNSKMLQSNGKSTKLAVADTQSADSATFFLPGRATNSADRVHVLIYSYTQDPDIGDGAVANHTFLTAYADKMKEFVAQDTRRVNVVARSDAFTEATIRSDIDALGDTTKDAIFCYISTHGTYSSAEGHQFLTTDRVIVPRSNVFAKMKEKNARLNVLITDSCANFAPGSASLTSMTIAPSIPATYCLYDLLFNTVGDLNMNGASPDPQRINTADGTFGEEGVYIISGSGPNSLGGIFTRAFIKEAIYGTSTDWGQFRARCVERTAAESDAANSRPQVPAVFTESGIWVHE